jgi:hypothetical protein
MTILAIAILWMVLIAACFAAFKVGADYDEDT